MADQAIERKIDDLIELGRRYTALNDLRKISPIHAGHEDGQAFHRVTIVLHRQFWAAVYALNAALPR